MIDEEDLNKLSQIADKQYLEWLDINLKTKWPYALLFLISTGLLYWVIWDTFYGL